MNAADTGSEGKKLAHEKLILRVAKFRVLLHQNRNDELKFALETPDSEIGISRLKSIFATVHLLQRCSNVVQIFRRRLRQCARSQTHQSAPNLARDFRDEEIVRFVF